MNIAIIGAGAAGLSAARDLITAGHRVKLFESLDRPGGLAIGFKEPHWDWTVEKFYHHWFASDHDLLTLAGEIGVREKLFSSRRRPSTITTARSIQSLACSMR